MYRSVADFLRDWDYESESTLKMLAQLTPESLTQRVTSDGRTLQFLAWHITQTHREMLALVGLQVDGPDTHDPPASSVEELRNAYQRSAVSVRSAVAAWSDDRLLDEADLYGERWTLGYTLFSLIRHEAHHRGQMTVLMRQAGLLVPGVYGPAREEWAGMGLPPMP